MTRNEILRLERRELDIALGKAIGAKVRSYRSQSSGRWLYELTLPGWHDSPDWVSMDGAWEGMPAFSSTWQGMGLVVEAMRAKGWGLELLGYVRGNFAARFMGEGHSDAKLGPSVDADSAPRAVALAALLALEEAK